MYTIKKVDTDGLLKTNQCLLTLNADIVKTIDQYIKANDHSEELRDKILIFSSVIFSKHLKYKAKKVHISRNYWVKIFGPREYYNIKEHALKCIVDKVTNHNQSHGIAAAYKIKSHLQTGSPKVIYLKANTKVSKKLNKHKENELLLAGQIEKRFGDHRLSLQNQFLLIIRSVFKQKKKVGSHINKLVRKGIISNHSAQIQQILVDGFINGLHLTKTIDRNGRVYNFISYLKKETRFILGRNWTQIDISSSHPYLISRIFFRLLYTPSEKVNSYYNFSQLFKLIRREWVHSRSSCKQFKTYENTLKRSLDLCKFLSTDSFRLFDELAVKQNHTNIFTNSVTVFNSGKLISELGSIIKLTRTGCFYEELVEKATSLKVDFTRLLYLVNDDFPDYKTLLQTELTNDTKKLIIKKAVMRWLYSKSTRKYYWKELFWSQYPNFTLLLQLVKESFSNTAIHSLTTLAESNLIFRTVYRLYKEDSIVAGTIHDSLIFKSKYLKQVQKILIDESVKQFGSPPHLKIQKMDFNSLIEGFP